MPKGNKGKKSLAAMSVSLLFLTLNLGMALSFSSGTIPFDKKSPDKTADTIPQEAADEILQVRVIKSNAVLRLKPKDDAVVLRKLSLGALLDVEEQLDDWLLISLPPDKDGFVVTGYLHQSFTEPSSIIHK